MGAPSVIEQSCDIFFLGAGKPAVGDKPAALKEIGLNTRALDWQLHSLSALPQPKIHFLGGYHIEEVMASYPQLHYTVVPDWQQHTLIHTLLQAPLRPVVTFILYADTVFRPHIIERVNQQVADVVLVYDSQWRDRYENRDASDIAHAEVLPFANGALVLNSNSTQPVEFTGLIKLSPQVTEFIATLDEKHIGRSLIDLIHHLASAGFTIAAIDAQGDWAEFNSPLDIAHFVLGTKAETLSRLAPLVKQSLIGKQVCFTVEDWQQHPDHILNEIRTMFSATQIVVRSSAKSEDNWHSSNAGGHTSILNIDGNSPNAITQAIEQVVASYSKHSHQDQILVQEFLAKVKCAGVIFTRSLETGGPHYRINFDDHSFSTESVTAGNGSNLRTILINRNALTQINTVAPQLLPVLNATRELEILLGYDRLDIEFAIDQQDKVHIFQVRPITVDHSEFEIEDTQVFSAIQNSVQDFQRMQTSTPFIVGERTLFGVMPDWNPAEIIGTRPRPLAFSLYRYLITDEVWAQQRAEFGYRDVRPQPLIVAFCHQPYVDIRASLNSFVPATVTTDTAEKLVNAYLTILSSHPQFHDKIEFDVAFTVWTPTFQQEASQRLAPLGISAQQIAELEQGLKIITRQAFSRLNTDITPLQQLKPRREQIDNSPLAPLDKAMVLLEDCRRFGTLAFSHAARAGFVAISFLKSLVNAGILSMAEKQAFLNSIKTIASEFEEDAAKVAMGKMEREAYHNRYGHLRPGTYDIMMEAYWEAPDRYLFAKTSVKEKSQETAFAFSPATQKAIELQLVQFAPDLTFAEFVHYLGAAIQAREAVKFEFTRNLSRALDYISQYGRDVGLTREELSYLQINELQQIKNGNLAFSALNNIIKQRKKDVQLTKMIELPQLLVTANDFYCFERMAAQPNFITSKCVTAPAITWKGNEHHHLPGSIVLIPQADPGYDWLFAHPIAGLITQYGGANSHMAIRAAEMALPAAIGVGDKLYEELSNSNYLHLDCALQQIRGVS